MRYQPTGNVYFPAVPPFVGDQELSLEAWNSTRARTLELCRQSIYGRAPQEEIGLELNPEGAHIEHTNGVIKQWKLTLSGPLGARQVTVLGFLPSTPAENSVTFLGYNFLGNHSVSTTEGILASSAPTLRTAGVGAQASRWDVDEILARGHALVTLHYEEIEPDIVGYATTGVRGMFAPTQNASADSWGAVAAWAWGLAQVRSALTQVPEINSELIMLFGHSRVGKSALWAAAQYEEFAGVVSLGSGCGGAALHRHGYGEDIYRISRNFPHWFAQNYRDYEHDADRLPVDQHQLLALIAPRPVLICSAADDWHADFRGEYLSVLHAQAVFELYDETSLLAASSPIPTPPDASTTAGVELPARHQLHGGRLGFFLRDGVHEVNAVDWAAVLDFVEQPGLFS